VSFSDEFPTADAMYASAASAARALRTAIPGNKPARSEDVARRMVKSARRGLEWHYRQLITYEWWKYQDKLEKALARVGDPVFSTPMFAPDDEPSETWRDAMRNIEFAKAHYGQATATLRARHKLMVRLGKDQVERTFLDNPRDGAKVMMVLDMLRDAFDGSYEDPQPVELALVAVVVGVDRQMKDGDPDGSENRRARWLQTLNKAKQLLSRELKPDPPGSRGR
jgi:hypothetical protein